MTDAFVINYINTKLKISTFKVDKNYKSIKDEFIKIIFRQAIKENKILEYRDEFIKNYFGDNKDE